MEENKKRSVGRPKGTKNVVSEYHLKLRLNQGEKDLLDNVFSLMKLDESKRGSKKKMFFRLIMNFIKNN